MGEYWTTFNDASIKNNKESFLSSPLIAMSGVSFRYQGSNEFVLSDIDLEIFKGDKVAIVGRTGSGKSTILNLILGLYPVTEGDVRIGGVDPISFVRNNPGEISLIPQEIRIIDGTLRQNIFLGLSKGEVSDDFLFEILRVCHLEDFVNKLPEGLESRLQDLGSNLSGGEKQRIGIARALVTKPKILIMDEATSALDSQTELIIQSNIHEMRDQITTITVAHRISTIQNCNLVTYISNGRVLAAGTFHQVKSEVPDFEEQSQLMGL
jgi:ATP-binding cassette subfamily C protein